MLALGIDPGTATTGYGLVHLEDGGALSMVDCGTILTPPDMPMPQRLALLHKGLSEILLLHQPDSGAVEKLFFQRNVRTAISVAQARGVALMALAEANLQVGEYSPVEVKQAVAGYGGAEKQQVQEMVRVLLGLAETPKPDDAADALAVAICHLHSSRAQQIYGMQAEG